MSTFMKARLTGVTLGIAAVALLADPGVASATIAGAGSVSANGAKFTTVITNLETDLPFLRCEGVVFDATKTDYNPAVDADPNVKLYEGSPAQVGSEYAITGPTLVAGQVITNGSGTGTSAEYPAGTYWVRTQCKEGSEIGSYQTPFTPTKLTITANSQNPSSTPSNPFKSFGTGSA
ncbi:hypothetical protein [Nocardia nepalensis]|uniref:hypothetical protein n=1 Tax=Nocardia nepalensis TaxID=3375448 RepID=UPI003B6763B9